LQDQGIPCHIEGENRTVWSGSGPLGNTGRWRMKLMIKAKDAEKAEQIIDSYDWPT